MSNHACASVFLSVIFIQLSIAYLLVSRPQMSMKGADVQFFRQCAQCPSRICMLCLSVASACWQLHLGNQEEDSRHEKNCP